MQLIKQLQTPLSGLTLFLALTCFSCAQGVAPQRSADAPQPIAEFNATLDSCCESEGELASVESSAAETVTVIAEVIEEADDCCALESELASVESTPAKTVGLIAELVEEPDDCCASEGDSIQPVKEAAPKERIAAFALEPALASLPIAIQEPVGFDHSHTLWTAVLKKHVRGTNFNYGALKKDPSGLEQYLSLLRAVTPAELKAWDKNQRYAFWINVYNANTIKIVVDNYPLKGIRSLDTALGINSVFDKKFIEMQPHHPEGKADKLSLNDVENTILREGFKDARVHAAVNCASISCPPLLGEAFVAERLESQLNAQMKAFINDASRNELDLKRNKVKASSIFKWFKDDFKRDAGSVNAYLARYVSDDLKQLVEKGDYSYLDYDWNLNDAK